MHIEKIELFSLDYNEYGPAWKWGCNTTQLGITERIYSAWLFGLCVDVTVEVDEENGNRWLKKETGQNK